MEPGGGTPGVLDVVPAGRAAVTVAVYVALAAVVATWVVRRRDVT